MHTAFTTAVSLCTFEDVNFQCSICHIPYKPSAAPFKINLTLCGLCRRKQVPDVLFTTIEPPPELQMTGRSCLIQARIVRARQKTKGEGHAKEISDSLPFMEYEMHNQLYNKLKIHCMNGLFGLKSKISISETMLIGVATATGIYISALPTPSIPKLSSQMVTEKENKNMQDLQRRIDEAVRKNKELYDLQTPDILSTQPSPLPCTSPLEENDEELSELDLSAGNKDTFVLEVDDANDETVNIVLQDTPLPDGFEVCNTQTLPGGTQNFLYNVQLFNQVWKGEIDVATCKSKEIAELFEKLLRKICFKLRKMTPCALCSLDFGIETPDEYELQISITGICVGLGDNLGDSSCFLELPPMNKTVLRTVSGSSLPSSGSEREDMIFDMDSMTDLAGKYQKSESSLRKSAVQSQVTKQRSGVELTPLSFVAGGKIDRYLGNYNFFFIRECTSLRESGGENGFVQTFIAEVMAILRSHVAALGGNALVAYKMNECILESNLHKNQSQCLVNVCGDAVHVNYDGETSLQTSSSEIVRKHSDSPGIICTV